MILPDKKEWSLEIFDPDSSERPDEWHIMQFLFTALPTVIPELEAYGEVKSWLKTHEDGTTERKTMASLGYKNADVGLEYTNLHISDHPSFLVVERELIVPDMKESHPTMHNMIKTTLHGGGNKGELLKAVKTTILRQHKATQALALPIG